MKMTKIETARIIVKQNGICRDVDCKNCFTRQGDCGAKKLVTVSWTARKLKLAESYIKRHEAKKNKKPKTVGIDNSDITIATVKKNLTVEPKPVVKENLCEEDCPANSEIPQPISLDDLRKMMFKEHYVYYLDIDEHIGRLNMKHVCEILIEFDMIAMKLTEKVIAKNYFRTLEEAVIVAKKLWNKEVTE